MIKLLNISQKYDRNWVLDNISHTFEDKKYLIMGPSGIGKTTLLNIIGKIMQPSSGTLQSDRRIGFIFQHFNLLNDFTIKENIEIAMMIKKRSGSYESIVELTGIKDILYKYPNQISGGQKQRSAIARTLADGSNFILADEPTGSLDDENSEKIRMLFNVINKELKIGFIISSHDTRWKPAADEVLTLKEGKLC